MQEREIESRRQPQQRPTIVELFAWMSTPKNGEHVLIQCRIRRGYPITGSLFPRNRQADQLAPFADVRASNGEWRKQEWKR